MEQYRLVAIIFFIISLLCFIYLNYISIRNKKVLPFLLSINDKIYEHNMKCIDLKDYDKMIHNYDEVHKTYNYILYSFKPLKYKNFVPKQYIELLNLKD